VSVAATAFRSSAYCAFVTSYFPILYGVATAPQGEPSEGPQFTGLVSAAFPGVPTVTQSIVTAEAADAVSAVARKSAAARRGRVEKTDRATGGCIGGSSASLSCTPARSREESGGAHQRRGPSHGCADSAPTPRRFVYRFLRKDPRFQRDLPRTGSVAYHGRYASPPSTWARPRATTDSPLPPAGARYWARPPRAPTAAPAGRRPRSGARASPRGASSRCRARARPRRGAARARRGATSRPEGRPPPACPALRHIQPAVHVE